MLRGYERARRILQTHPDVLARLADALLEEATLDAARVEAVVRGENSRLERGSFAEAPSGPLTHPVLSTI